MATETITAIIYRLAVTHAIDRFYMRQLRLLVIGVLTNSI